MKKSFTLVEDFFYVLNFCTTIILLLRRTLVLHQIIHKRNAAPWYIPLIRSHLWQQVISISKRN